ncbi:MAG: hypothetical protein JW881_16650 [Spirochaetales bacterium]|nr:hypothetical protein [Spirochaetales bacterium]
METSDNSQNQQYRTYQNSEDSFSVDLPVKSGEMEQQTREIQTDSGARKMRGYIASLKDKAFIIGVIELGMVLDNEQKSALVHESREDLAANGEVLFKGETEIDGFAALTLRLCQDYEGMKSYVDVLFTVIADRLFQLEVVATSVKKLEEEDTTRFFQSFSYTVPGPGTE